MYDLDVTNPANNGRRLAGVFYETNGSGGTPTRETLKRIGDEYANAAGPIKYACQRNNAFIVTDGFANVASVNPPAYSQATWGTGAPYATTYADSLANLALGFYTINPRTGMATGKVLKTATDDNTDLHVNTYGLTIGSRGVAFQDETSIPPAPPSDWVAPTQNRHPSAVDDLWHATINGRGSMYLASTPTETAEKIQKAMSDILSQTGAQGGIAVSTVNLSRGDSRAYFGTYNPAGWAGDLTGNPIDKTTGVVSTTAHWSASDQLTARDWTTRQIASWNGSTGVSFTAAAVGGTVNPGNLYGDTGEVMDYLRGDRTHEGTKFRTRTSLIGAIINSEPVISRDHGVAYVQSGEGMLHAFDTRDPNGGSELWAFVPRSVLANIGETAQRGYVFGTQLDGSATLTKLSASSTVLVAGTGVAGRSFHAIDVSSPRGLSQAALAANVKWEFPAFGDATTQAKVGQAIGRPVVVTTKNDGQVALLTSGYNNTLDGKGRLWMVNVNTGAIVHEFTTADGSLATEAGLAQVSAFGEYDGTVRYVYGGDLLGNVWKFDLELKTAPFKLAVLKNASNQTQPVTAAPELLNQKGDRIVYVGTGRILDITDFGNTSIQSFYAIKDGAYLPNARTSLVKQIYTRATDTITNNPVDWTTDRGWFLDLTAGEQANTRPIIAYGAIAFVTNINGGNDCSASSYLYVLDVASGSKYAGAAFTSRLLSASANSSAVTALRTVTIGRWPGQDRGLRPDDRRHALERGHRQRQDHRPGQELLARDPPLIVQENRSSLQHPRGAAGRSSRPGSGPGRCTADG